MTAGTPGAEPARHTGRAAPGRAASAPTMLKVLLRERNWHSYTMFKRAYVKSARKLDLSLVDSYPSDRTFKRWVSGRVRDSPRAEHCAVLEEMFPGWSVPELLQPCTAPGNDQDVTLLQELLRQRHLHAYRNFCKGYDDAARRVNSTLVGTHPTERQFYSWVSGEKIGLPHPDHRSVLEAMFPGYSARQLFERRTDISSTDGERGGDISTEEGEIASVSSGRLEGLDDSRSASSDQQPGIQWNRHSITLAVRQITGEDLSITRRQALATGASAILVGDALTEPLQQWLLPIKEYTGSATRSHNFSSTELATLEALVEQFRDWSSIGNGALARKAVIAQLNDVTDRLNDAPSGPLAWRAFRVAAELSEVVASISWDAGLHRCAQRYYVASVQLAKLANDDGLAATVLADLARQCYDLGHSREGLETVQLAQYGSRRAATPLLRAMLATREGWGYAQQGDAQAFRRTVGLAEDYFSEGPSDGDHRSVRYFDAAELTGVIGGRYRDLARHEPKYVRNAQDYIQEALKLRHPSRPRLYSFDLIGLARTHLVSAEPEHACELVNQAIPIARSWVNGRVGVKLREFHQEASQYAAIPVVRDTRDLIRELTSSH